MGHVLVLGGTGWLGGEVARRARDAGHAVTCAARGIAHPAPDGTRLLRMDRSVPGAYDSVQDRDWDAVVDVTSQPSQVAEAVQALGERAAHWTYVSSASVYKNTDVVGEDENAPVLAPLEGDMDTMAEYGAAKSACERLIMDAVGDRALVVRAGLIAGPGDPSDRFGYWVSRLALAGDRDVLVPDAAQLSTQTIDVRDIAVWIASASQAGVHGIVNAVGQATRLGDVLATSAEVAGFGGRLVPARPAWLTDHGVQPWSGPRSLPLWLPLPEYAGFGARSDHRCRQTGLGRRPLADTMRDVLVDERSRGLDRPRRAGLTVEEEHALLTELDHA